MRVPQSVAQGRQILGCKWVYKRKTGKDGEVTRYRARLVGSLLHISNCLRPDVSYAAVGNLARFAAAPGDAHVKAARRVLQYLYRTKSLGIT